VRFSFNPEKAVEAIVWVASKQDGGVDLYRILKTIFDAEVTHLNSFGLPIVGDDFIAMQYGPVPGNTYDIIKLEDPIWNEEIENKMGSVPFSKIEKGGKTYFIVPNRQPNLDVFSENNLHALSDAWEKCKGLSFNELHGLYAKHPSYITARENRHSEREIMNIAEWIDNPRTTEQLAEIGSKLVL